MEEASVTGYLFQERIAMTNNNPQNEYHPDYVSPPGETLLCQ